MRYFNPRAREGRDFFNIFPSRFLLLISIHAPVKGATYNFLRDPTGDRNFNPRAREGRDIGKKIKDICISIFQSTRP